MAEAVFSAAAALMAEFESVAAGVGLTKQQVLVLRSLTVPVSMATLAHRTRIDPSNLTGVIARLERSGLVTRQRDNADRRVTVVALTENGADIAATFEQRLAASTPLLNRLDRTERMTLQELLDRLR